LKTGSTPFGLKIPLVPTFVFPLGWRGLSIESKAFDVIAADRDEPSNFRWPQSRCSASRSGAPVVAHQDRLLEVKNVDQSLSDRAPELLADLTALYQRSGIELVQILADKGRSFGSLRQPLELPALSPSEIREVELV
jgi:hypothetical protein